MSLTIGDENVRPGFVNITAAVCGLLAVFGLLELLIGWTQTPDVRAWWPFLVASYLVIVFVYGALFSAAMEVAKVRSYRLVLIYNVLLGTMLLIHTALFYTMKADPLGVSDGSLQLTILQTVVSSQVTHLAIFLAFLAGAWIVAGATYFSARH